MANLQTAAGFLNAMINEWAIRVGAICSLAAHVVLALFAGVRRREATSPGTLVVWLAYQVADAVASTAISKLTFGSTPREQQLVALWLPFFLMHLGGPDNITALSLEDNKLSKRQVFKTLFQLLGTAIAMYKQYIAGTGTGTGPLLWASVAMLAVGVVKFLERAFAFWKAQLDKIRTSTSSKEQRDSLKIQPPRRSDEELGDERALLVAHELLHITKGAFADYWVNKNPFKNDNNLKEIFSVSHTHNSGWKNMCKVVQMEVSLMYDLIYTKAAVTHTWTGYLVRVASPIATAATTFLFWLSYNKDGQRTVDVIITYTLLVVTILLDVWWLLRAAASTWTYAFLNGMPECWLHHEVLCSGKWRQLRLAVMALDMREWQLHKRQRGSYRLWSRTIGQYNLFEKCTYGDTKISLISKAVKMVAPEDTWIEYNYSKGLDLHKSPRVDELLFEKIEQTLEFYPKPEPAKKDKPKPAVPAAAPAPPPDDGIRARRRLDEAMGFLPELQELILIWHIATDIFLWDNQHLMESGEHWKHVETIKAMSNYMVFLAVARPDMLPGLKIRSLCDVTREALDKIWQRKVDSSPGSTWREHSEQKLARILLEMTESDLYEENLFLSDATKFAKVLQEWLNPHNWKKDWDLVLHNSGIRVESAKKKFLFLIPEMEKWKNCIHMDALLASILKSWVRMLIYVSTRCSRDSHVKQLGRGGDLTTIAWILTDHVGIFGYKERDRKHS